MIDMVKPEYVKLDDDGKLKKVMNADYTRKPRIFDSYVKKSGSSLQITIPKQVCDIRKNFKKV